MIPRQEISSSNVFSRRAPHTPVSPSTSTRLPCSALSTPRNATNVRNGNLAKAAAPACPLLHRFLSSSTRAGLLLLLAKSFVLSSRLLARSTFVLSPPHHFSRCARPAHERLRQRQRRRRRWRGHHPRVALPAPTRRRAGPRRGRVRRRLLGRRAPPLRLLPAAGAHAPGRAAITLALALAGADQPVPPPRQEAAQGAVPAAAASSGTAALASVGRDDGDDLPALRPAPYLRRLGRHEARRVPQPAAAATPPGFSHGFWTGDARAPAGGGGSVRGGG